ncbi:MAG: N-formylglutamate amidohydrolase [Bacteroidota bacterium]
MKFLLTCEHGGNEIPEDYKKYFINAGNILNSHRGYDPGALDMFYFLKDLADYSYYKTTSRLLIELNRSLHHSKLFSEFTKNLSLEEKNSIVDQFYLPYRNSVEGLISEILEKGEKVIHVSVHSFSPEIDGIVRNADVGLLFDPSKAEEKNYCKILKKQLLLSEPKLEVRFNYPYLGKADGLTTFLRKKFPHNYSGIELEINQKFSVENQMDAALKDRIKLALKNSLKI